MLTARQGVQRQPGDGDKNKIRGIYTDAIERGQSNGEIAPNLDPADAALFLYSFGQALRVTGRIAKLADLERTVDIALRAILPAGR